MAFFDPAYLMLLCGGDAGADKASNFFHMGPLLGCGKFSWRILSKLVKIGKRCVE